MQPKFLILILLFVMFWSQIVSVIFQKAASGVGIDPSSETDFVRAIDTVLCISEGKNCWQCTRSLHGGSGTYNFTWHSNVWFSDWSGFKSWTPLLACSWVTVETSSVSQCPPLFQSKVMIILCRFATFKHILLHTKCFCRSFLLTLVSRALIGYGVNFFSLTLFFLYI